MLDYNYGVVGLMMYLSLPVRIELELSETSHDLLHGFVWCTSFPKQPRTITLHMGKTHDVRTSLTDLWLLLCPMAT